MKNLVLASALLASAITANATVIVDQSFYKEQITGGLSVSHDEFRRVQTFTVGVAGRLNSVQVFTSIDRYAVFSSIKILSTVFGAPGDVLGQSFELTSVNSSVTFDVSQLGLQVSVGDVLGFEVVGNGYINAQYGYAGGSDYYLNPPYGVDKFKLYAADSFFVTTVDDLKAEVPEPASLALFGLGAMGVASLRRRKPKN